jgi:hypothetical protein
MALFSSLLDRLQRLCTRTTQLRVIEVHTPSEGAVQLFQKGFGQQAPDTPRHFELVLKHRRGEPTCMGYVHYTPFEDAYLCGGMTVDAYALRRLPEALRVQVRARGSLAEWLLQDSHAALMPCAAVFGHVGDAKALIVDLRVGFKPTTYEHLYVWQKPGAVCANLTGLIERVHALGPF